MAGTRATRGRSPGTEELRFDFGADAGQPQDLASSPPDRSQPSREHHLAPEPPRFSVVTEEPTLRPGSASDAALSVSDFYNQVRGALREAFPEEVWVTGEIRKVTDSRGHHYIELADHFEGPVRPTSFASPTRGVPPVRGANATLEVACWARDWPVVAYDLAAVGVELVPGLVVRVRGKVAVWEGGSKLRFSMTALDVEALVGGIAAARRRLLGALAAEDLLEANRRLAPPLVPLRIGLVTSLGSEAYGDFTGQLQRSGYVFELRFEPSIVQGPEAPGRIAGALRRLATFEPHLVVLVRGGGAKGDLAAFDSELVARAIALAPFPVWTGIGHTGDRSVADEVAQRSLVTPTQCGEAVVAAVGSYLEGVDRRARRLAQRVEARLDEASRELSRCSGATGRAARENLERSHLALRAAETRIGNAALVAIERSHGQLINRAQRLAAPSSRQITVEAQRVAHRRELLALLDPQRQLERGWSLTRDERGRLVRSSASLRVGEKITTTFADGTATSVLDEIGSTGATGEEGNR